MTPFAKYAGCGNDFILFDNRNETFPISHTFIQRLCHRQLGIGADGLILLENPTKNQAHFRFRIFNCDGSEAQMCGNGIRCFVKWLSDKGFNYEFYLIQTMHSILRVKFTELGICVEMSIPCNIEWDIPLYFENQYFLVNSINTGVPHVVLFTQEVENINIEKLGCYIRNHPLWLPEGTNLTVAQKKQTARIKIRTYERGVERETLSCGTGATAAAISAAHHYRISEPITVETRLGEELYVGFTVENQKFSGVTLTGSADCIFIGQIDFKK